MSRLGVTGFGAKLPAVVDRIGKVAREDSDHRRHRLRR
jgi:hypothetical protein